MALFVGLYYGNVWNALDFPFLSQQLFSSQSNATSFDVYNQSLILDEKLELDPAALEIQGLPFFAATNASYLLTTNLGITATVVHIFLWNRDAVRDAFSFRLPKLATLRRYATSPSLLWKKQSSARLEDDEKLDPHYRQMLAYKEVPSWWYMLILLASVFIAIICIYTLESTLPWWGFVNRHHALIHGDPLLRSHGRAYRLPGAHHLGHPAHRRLPASGKTRGQYVLPFCSAPTPSRRLFSS